MNNRRSVWCVILFSFLGISVTMAQEPEKKKHWVWELYGGVNNYMTWEVETGVVYKPWRFIGVGAGLLFTTLIDDDKVYSGDVKDKKLHWCIEEKDLTYLMAFRSGIYLYSPPVYLNHDRDVALSFRVSPGITIPLPPNSSAIVDYVPEDAVLDVPVTSESVSSSHARACYYHVRFAVALEMERLSILLGYTTSDYDLYGGSRNMVVGGQKIGLPHKKQTGTFFIGLTYDF